MLVGLPLISPSMPNILGIDVATVNSPVLHINFAKIHKDSEVVLSMTLLFGRMLSLVKRFHLSVMNRVIILPYQWEIDAFGCDDW